MKKKPLLLILFAIVFFITSCEDKQCGCTYPIEVEFYKSWRLNYTDVNGKQVPSDKKEIITFDAVNKPKAVYQKEIDGLVIEKTLVDEFKEIGSSDNNEVLVTMTLDNVTYKQKLKLAYVSGKPQMLIATAKVKVNESLGDYILHYEFYQK